jgi:hypothetical protein
MAWLFVIILVLLGHLGWALFFALLILMFG